MNTQTRQALGAADAKEIFFPDFADPGFQRDPYPAYRAAREQAPIFWSPRHRQYLALGAGAVRCCLQSPDFIVDSPFRASRRLFGRTIMDVDGHEHTRLRVLANKGFVPGRYEAYKQRYVVPVIEELAGRLHARGGGDFVSEFADQIPSRVMAYVIGIPVGRWQEFHRLSTPIIDYLDTASPERLRAAQASYALLTEIVLPVIDAKLAEPDDTIIGELARARCEGKELSYEEIVRQIGLMIPAAIDTTNRLIANALYLLASDPSWQERLRAQDGLLPNYIEEVMRFEPPIHSTIRICARDTVVEGFAIPKGALVNIVLAAGNRDPAAFLDPDRFDPERPELRGHLSFGGGKHQCMGRFFAVVEVSEALRALLRRPGRLAFASESCAPICGAAFRSPPHLNLMFV
jgi:cytochrome P450